MGSRSRLAQIEDKLTRLIELDRDRRVFGARWPGFGHEYRRDPPLSAEYITELEGRLGARLPEEYRQFLMHCHAGGAGPGYGLEPPRPHDRIEQPFPVTRVQLDDYLAHEDPEGLGLHLSEFDREGCLGLADHGCASESLLVLRGELAGTVWDLWDHPYQPGWSVAPVRVRAGLASFLDWYEEWLDRSLSQVAEDRSAE